MPSSSTWYVRLVDTEIGREVLTSWRALRRRPGFLVVAVVSLGLAIALNTVMYSVLDALLEPVVDVQRPAQLFKLRYYGNTTHRLERGALLSVLESGRHSYEGVSGYAAAPAVLIEHDHRLQQASSYAVRPDFLGLLGVRPVAGRVFAASDASSAACGIVISDRLSAQLFARHETPLGAGVRVDDRECTVIGVIPKYPTMPPLDADVWRLPSPQAAALPINIIRLRPGASPRLVENELAVLAARLAVNAGEGSATTRFDLKPWFNRQFRVSNFHYALIAAVLAVLLVACANLANLQLARGIGRGRELATRAALGAPRSRIIRHLLAETGIVAALGLVLGLVLTFIGIHVLSASIPETIADYIVAPRTSWGMFAFAAIVALACVALVGLAPAIRVSRVDPNELLKSGAGTGAHKRNTRLYGWLIIGEVGLTIALLCGGVVLVRSAWRLADRAYLTQAIFGFDPTPLIGVTVAHQAPAGARVPIADAAADVVTRLKAQPGVADAAFHTSDVPKNRAVTVIDGMGFLVEVPAPSWTVRVVSPSFFPTMGYPIVKGRDLTESGLDARDVVIDVPTAKLLWPKADPIGKMIKFGDRASTVPWSRVVGVVGDLLDRERYGTDPVADWPHLGAVYRAISLSDSVESNGTYLVTANVRASRDAEGLAVMLRHALLPTAVDGRLAVEPFVDADRITWRRTRTAFVASLFMIFASIAVALAAIGVNGLVAHSVAERRREIGVRIALGATPRDVLRALLRDSNALALAGVALGLWLTMRTVAWLGMFLGAFDAYDSVLFATVAAALFVIVVVAALIPGIRATRIDPVESLRPE